MRHINLPKRLVGFYYFIFGAGFLILALNTPKVNWDIIPYVALAQHVVDLNFDAVHERTYQNLELYYGTEVGDKLRNSEYRRRTAMDSEFLEGQLPFYKIRFVYIHLIYILDYLGMNIFFATHFISAVSMLVSLFLFFLIIRTRTPDIFQILFAPLFLLLGGFDLARFSTPDALAVAAVMTCIFLLFQSRFKILWIILPFLILIRTDLILFTILISLVVLAKNRNLLPFIGSILASFCVYFWISHTSGHYGWSIILRTTLLEKIYNPETAVTGISIKEYLQILFKGFRSMLNPLFIIFVATSVYGLFQIRKLHSENRIQLGSLIVLPFVYVILHFLLFPIIWTRFFSVFYLLSLVGVVMIWTEANLVLESDQTDSSSEVR